MADVIGYEEKDPATVAAMKSGYPRFKLPGLVEQANHFVSEKFGYPGEDVLLLSSAKAMQDLSLWLVAREKDAILPFEVLDKVYGTDLHGIHAVRFKQKDSDCLKTALKFLQHTGTGISSRLAEEYLRLEGVLPEVFKEDTHLPESGDPHGFVKSALSDLTGVSQENLLLCSSGMNAFYAAFKATCKIQRPKNRKVWIQLGWLYLDTGEILKKFLLEGETYIPHLDVFDIKGLEALLDQHSGEVAAIVTEAPTNPLIQTPDMGRIYTLAQKHGAVLIADPTSATPANVDLLPYSDVLANSLTKYAGNQGDVLSGALFFNPKSPYVDELKDHSLANMEPLYIRDAARLAHEIQDYREILGKINENTLALAEFFEGHPGIAKAHWAFSPDSKANYDKLARHKNAPGGLITIETTGPMQPVHDRLQMLKSPSFGTEWSMVCPFMYLAHYDLVSTPDGREFLQQNGINPDLLRISVGTEPADQLVETFRVALEG